jgi:hypothetical protein
MNKRVVFTNFEGKCAVLIPAPEMFDPNSRTRTQLASNGVSFEGKTDDDILQWIISKDIPAGTAVSVIDASELPQDRYFRNSWKLSGGKAVVDMDSARTFHMNKIREIRNSQLSDLDRDWMKASGQKKQKDADDIEVKRQLLRDLPQNFDLTKATTPEELKTLWPDGLPKV